MRNMIVNKSKAEVEEDLLWRAAKNDFQLRERQQQQQKTSIKPSVA